MAHGEFSLWGDDAERLFSRLFDGDLAEHERRAVEQRLCDDAAFRDRYLKWSLFEADLEAIFEETRPVSPPKPLRNARRWTRFVPWSITAAAVMTLLLIGMLILRHEGRLPSTTNDPGIAKSERKADVRERPTDGRSLIFEATGDATLAVIVDSEGISEAHATELPVGRRLPAGRLRLDSGRLLLFFLGGTTLYLEGRAELVLQSVHEAKLLQGRAALRDLGFARPFRLNVPDASMVDLGTEFAVQTDASGNSLVRVHEGAISVSMLDPAGVTHISDILGEGDLMALRPHEPVPIREESGGEHLPRVPPVPQATLSISQDYVSAVRDSGPVLYWRFEELDAEGLIPDEGLLGCRGRLVNEAQPHALALKDGAVHFQRSTHPRHVASERLLPGINTEELTVELWVQTTHVAWQTLFGMVIRQPPNEKKAAAVLEFAYESDFVHGPMAIRGLSRAQPAPRGGTNVFANDVWMPGAWHHIVLVRRRDSLQLFVDGQLASESTYSPSGDMIPYRIVLGQLHAVGQGRSRHPPRRFVGALDEFALYDRALTPAEIATHHHLGVQHGD